MKTENVDATMLIHFGTFPSYLLGEIANVSRRMCKEKCTFETIPAFKLEMSEITIVRIISSGLIEKLNDANRMKFQAAMIKNGIVVGAISYYVFLETTNCVVKGDAKRTKWHSQQLEFHYNQSWNN